MHQLLQGIRRVWKFLNYAGMHWFGFLKSVLSTFVCVCVCPLHYSHEVNLTNSTVFLYMTPATLLILLMVMTSITVKEVTAVLAIHITVKVFYQFYVTNKSEHFCYKSGCNAVIKCLKKDSLHKWLSHWRLVIFSMNNRPPLELYRLRLLPRDILSCQLRLLLPILELVF